MDTKKYKEMKIHLYTNFTLGSGFGYAELTQDGLTKANIPPIIKADFVNGACKIVLNSLPSEDIAYLLVKGIVYTNKDKRIDDQGRKVFINFAIEDKICNLHKLAKVLNGLLVEWKSSVDYVGSLFTIPYSNEYNYTVDYTRFAYMVTQLQNISAESDTHIDNIIKTIKSGDSLVVLKGDDKGYYQKMADDVLSKTLKGQHAIGRRHIITESEFLGIVEKSNLDTTLFESGPEHKRNISDNLDYAILTLKEEKQIEGSNLSKDVESEAMSVSNTLPLKSTEDDKEKETKQPDTTLDNSNVVGVKERSIRSTRNVVSLPVSSANKLNYYIVGAFALGAAIGFTLGRFLSSH